MLPRVLEPEVMDTPEEALAYDAMDHAEVNRTFVDDLLAAGPLGSELLDLGTGTALIPIELCQREPNVRVVAVDLSASMLNLAKGKIDMAGLRDRVMLDRVDGKHLPYGDARFDTVISNSIVHHIPQPELVLAEAWRVVAPGGLVFFRDLLRPADEEQVRRLVETYAGEESEHARQLFEASLRAALTLGEVRQIVAALGLDPASVQQTSDRHWTWSARKPG